MCEGGVVGDQVFNKVTANIVIMKDGSAPRSYKDICPVNSNNSTYQIYRASFRMFTPTSQHGWKIAISN